MTLATISPNRSKDNFTIDDLLRFWKVFMHMPIVFLKYFAFTWMRTLNTQCWVEIVALNKSHIRVSKPVFNAVLVAVTQVTNTLLVQKFYTGGVE